MEIFDHAEHIVHHEHLPVAMRARADADGRHARLLGHLGGKVGGDLFEHVREHARLLNGFGVAEELIEGKEQPDDDEFLEVVRMPFDKAVALVRSGKIKDSKTVIGLLACALWRDRRVKKTS